MNNSNNNQTNVSLFSEAMDRFKMLIFQEVCVNLRSGYNASLTSREAGDLGNRWSRRCIPNEQQNSTEIAVLLWDTHRLCST